LDAFGVIPPLSTVLTADGLVCGGLCGSGDGQPGKTGIEFLLDAFCGTAAEAFDLIDGLEFTIECFDAPAFAVERDQVFAGRDDGIGQRGQQYHLVAHAESCGQ
jgi:hypothetical protein